MIDISRVIIAVILMITPWVMFELGKSATEYELKIKENDRKIAILKSFVEKESWNCYEKN